MHLSKWRLVVVVVTLGWGIDQLTKFWAINRLGRGRKIEILPTLELDLTYNSGFSFGIGAGYGSLVGVVVILVSGYIFWLLCQETSLVRSAIFAAILAGALGNLSDRLLRARDGFLSGNVVDFIDITWYAVFNVADMLVVCGCILLLLNECHRRIIVAESANAQVSEN